MLRMRTAKYDVTVQNTDVSEFQEERWRQLTRLGMWLPHLILPLNIRMNSKIIKNRKKSIS